VQLEWSTRLRFETEPDALTITDTIAETKTRALALSCPFCGASAGQLCRARKSGREQDWPHSRRIALTRTAPEHVAARVNALCCVCGNRRTVSDDYSRRQDPNYSGGVSSHPQGWRSTQTLKCGECGEQTRHAILRAADSKWRDYDEELQLCALGDESLRGKWSDERIARLRREYREMFPRNPKLHHNWFRGDAEQAMADGNPRMLAICGETIDTPTQERHNRGNPPPNP
jgi:hypothetical protein